MSKDRILVLDVGSFESGYCIVDPDYKIYEFGKIDNQELLTKAMQSEYTHLVYEEFQSYGMPLGDSTIKAITWNGRYIQAAHERNIPITPIYRKDVKINLCGTMRAKDTNIRQALIDRFAKHDFKNGKGRKDSPDFFYGFKADVWSAYALATTYLDKQKEMN